MTTSEPQPSGGEVLFDLPLTSSPADSPASRSPPRASSSASRTNGGDGRGCGTSSTLFDLDMSSSRTSQRCLGTPKLFASSSETLPNSGSMQSGLLYQRARWVPHTHETGCSFWPTPRAADAQRGGVLGRDRHFWNLCDAVRNRDGQGPVDPAPHGVAYGVPRGMDRRKALGNAVVPAVGETIGRLIIEHSALLAAV
jgi:hypothetical protein